PSIQMPSPPQIQQPPPPPQPILLTQIPFQLNKPPIIQKIPHLLTHNKIHPITHLPDQTTFPTRLTLLIHLPK
ncbi:hypothetical protein, partial [Staphylococcus epidermidis]|uniref:hypothetical protein n=1 Tax=Staphylococcus epidermidis TaxID=1282 RepID=UPI001C930C96